MTCKDCIHNELCEVMHKFGVVDLPYNDETICELFKNKADVIELPCKVGDTLWVIISEEFVDKVTVEKVVLREKGIYMKLSCNAMYETSCNSIGKTVFLTKEEAEQKLKEGVQE